MEISPPFCEREIVGREILHSIQSPDQQNAVFNIFGCEEIGKTSVATALWHLVREERDAVFISLRGIEQFDHIAMHVLSSLMTCVCPQCVSTAMTGKLDNLFLPDGLLVILDDMEEVECLDKRSPLDAALTSYRIVDRQSDMVFVEMGNHTTFQLNFENSNLHCFSNIST